MNRLRTVPEIRLLAAGFGLSLLWELLQSPFYADTFVVAWTTLVYNRLHCAVGDAMIVLVAFWLVALGWGRGWMQIARWVPCTIFLAIGIAYTAASEHVNVHLMQRWAYSEWMPTIAGIGLVPLLQWLIVPMLCVWWVRRRRCDDVGAMPGALAEPSRRRPLRPNVSCEGGKR